ncbi:MAG: ABC transporter permease [Treponema sp.]|jgi:rhamnose transport system permease protein|nr:ABC transporter permease [Treponema sp.]
MNGIKRFINTSIKELVTLGIIVFIFLVSGIAKADLFSSRFPSIVNSVILWMPLNLTMAMGMMMVVIVRDIDLSIGSLVAFSAMVVGILFRDAGIPLWLGVALCLLIGTLCGALNGFLVAHIKIPAIIVTLGTMNAFRGFTFIISRGAHITTDKMPAGIKVPVQEGLWLGEFLFPWMVLFSFAVAVLFFFILRYSHFGREVYAVGSNREGAHLRGINCKKTEFLIFTITGFLAGITGLMSISRFGYVNPSNTGTGLEFVVISATIIGGVSVSGGKGSVAGVFLGCLLLGTVNTMISTVGIPGTVQRFCYGFIIVIALLIDQVITEHQQKVKLREFKERV